MHTVQPSIICLHLLSVCPLYPLFSSLEGMQVVSYFNPIVSEPFFDTVLETLLVVFFFFMNGSTYFVTGWPRGSEHWDGERCRADVWSTLDGENWM